MAAVTRKLLLVRNTPSLRNTQRSMVEFTGLASRVPDYEAARGAKGASGSRSGLKVVVENRNIYEGQYMRIEHVVPDDGTPSPSPPKPSMRAMPAWMGGSGVRLGGGRGTTAARLGASRRPAGPGHKLLR